MSRMLFGAILVVIGLLYLWLAFQEVSTEVSGGDGWVPYLGGLLFLAAAVAAGVAGINLVRPKRR